MSRATKVKGLAMREWGQLRMSSWGYLVVCLVAFAPINTRADDPATPSADANTRGWRLNVANGAEAKVQPIANTVGALRVEVTKPAQDEKPGAVQIAHELVAVEKDGLYEVSFLAKAANARQIYFGVIEDKAPWNGIGLYEAVDLTNKWRRVTKRFLATQSVAHPRIIFHVGSHPETVELADVSFSGDWRLFTQEGSSADFIRLVEDPRLLRLRITKLGEQGGPSRVQLARGGLEVKKGDAHVVAFMAKATKPRSIKIAASLASAPYTGLGLYKSMDINENWQAFNVPFEPNADATDARLYFDLGDSDASVEISDFSLLDGEWKVVASEGASAGVFRPIDSPDILRVGITKIGEKPAVWHVQAIKEGIAVDKDKEYAVTFRARSDEPRKGRIAVSQAAKPYSVLGLYREFELTKDWQPVELKFKANADEANARLYFDLGDNAASIELTDVELRPAG